MYPNSWSERKYSFANNETNKKLTSNKNFHKIEFSYNKNNHNVIIKSAIAGAISPTPDLKLIRETSCSDL